MTDEQWQQTVLDSAHKTNSHVMALRSEVHTINEQVQRHDDMLMGTNGKGLSSQIDRLGRKLDKYIDRRSETCPHAAEIVALAGQTNQNYDRLRDDIKRIMGDSSDGAKAKQVRTQVAVQVVSMLVGGGGVAALIRVIGG